jgi:hypothetical protein
MSESLSCPAGQRLRFFGRGDDAGVAKWGKTAATLIVVGLFAAFPENLLMIWAMTP